MMSLTSIYNFNHSKRLNFISSWKMVKNTMKLCRRFLLYKTNKKCKENQGWDILYIRGSDVTYSEFKALRFYNFKKSDQNAKKNFVKGSLSIKALKICHKNKGEVLASGPLKDPLGAKCGKDMYCVNKVLLKGRLVNSRFN